MESTFPRRAAAVLLAAASIVVALPAGATTAVHRDRNDSPGLLDVRRVLHRHAGEGILVHRVRTFEKWGWSIFNQGSYVELMFFVNGGPARDRTLWVTTSPDGTPYAEMNDKAGDTVGYARVWKPSRRTLLVEFPKNLLGKNVRRYRWTAETTFHQDGHEECGGSTGVIVYCFDRAPNRGSKMRHRLGN